MNDSPKVTLRLDTSQIIQALKCPTYHDFVSVQNLMKKRSDRTAMDRGTVIHGLIQRYYQKIWEGAPWAEAMSYGICCLTELKREVKLANEEYKPLLIRFNDYCIKYHAEHVEVATIIDSTGVKKPALETGFSTVLLDTPEVYFVLEGRIDMIAVMSGINVIWDHKAQGRQYNLYGHSIQMLNYALAVDTNYTMYNYIRLHQKIQPNTFVRQLKFIPRWLQERWKEKLISYFHHIALHRIETMRQNDFPNLACSDMGFGKQCPFTSVCEEQSGSVRQKLIETNFETRKQWQPWTLDEISPSEEEAE